MTLSSITPLITYTATNGQTDFPLPNQFYDAPDVQVWLETTEGEDQLVYDADYTVVTTGEEPIKPGLKSGIARLTVPRAAGEIVVVGIWPKANQDQQYHGIPITARQRERVVDRLALGLAMLREMIGRSYRAPLNEPAVSRTIETGQLGDLAYYTEKGLAPLASPKASELASLAGFASGRALVYPPSPAPEIYDAFGRKIGNLGAPTLGGDAANKTYVDAQVAGVVTNGVTYADMPWVLGWENGVTGNGSNQLAALQAIVNSLPVEGGAILLRGDVYLGATGQLDLHGRRNILICGLPGGGNGAGAGQRTLLRSGHGAIGANIPVINCKGTFNVSFENLYIYNNNAAFNGNLIDYGSRVAVVPGDDSALMHWKNIYFSLASGTGFGLQLHGSTQGIFESVTFAGRGVLVALQNIGGVGFVNNHKFIDCNFKPTGAEYPVSGSGEAVTFIGCNIQASSGDGIGRFLRTSLSQPFRSISLLYCTFYDVLTAGGVWAEFYWGQNPIVQGCIFGGVTPSAGTNYGITLGGGGLGLNEPGVIGHMIEANQFRFMTAGIACAGVTASGTNPREGSVKYNYAFGGSSPKTALFSSRNLMTFSEIGPNHIESGNNDPGAHIETYLPTSSAGLQSGTWWNNAGVVNITP